MVMIKKQIIMLLSYNTFAMKWNILINDGNEVDRMMMGTQL